MAVFALQLPGAEPPCRIQPPIHECARTDLQELRHALRHAHGQVAHDERATLVQPQANKNGRTVEFGPLVKGLSHGSTSRGKVASTASAKCVGQECVGDGAFTGGDYRWAWRNATAPRLRPIGHGRCGLLSARRRTAKKNPLRIVGIARRPKPSAIERASANSWGGFTCPANNPSNLCVSERRSEDIGLTS